MSPTTPPEYVLKELRLLLHNLTTPETNVSFVTPARADPGAIEESIRRPPEATWTWARQRRASASSTSAPSISASTGFRPISATIQAGEHLARRVAAGPGLHRRDVDLAEPEPARLKTKGPGRLISGRSATRSDIDKYFRLDDVTGAYGSRRPIPARSAPFELSTGASDADATTSIYRLQVAFEDVWAELIDESIGTTAKAFYAKWDALINEGMANDLDQ